MFSHLTGHSSILPYIKNLSGGTRTILLTVLISTVLAVVKPIPEIEGEQNER